MKLHRLCLALLVPSLALAQPMQETDPRSIWKNGASITSAEIPLAQGLSVPASKFIWLGNATLPARRAYVGVGGAQNTLAVHGKNAEDGDTTAGAVFVEGGDGSFTESLPGGDVHIVGGSAYLGNGGVVRLYSGQTEYGAMRPVTVGVVGTPSHVAARNYNAFYCESVAEIDGDVYVDSLSANSYVTTDANKRLVSTTLPTPLPTATAVAIGAFVRTYGDGHDGNLTATGASPTPFTRTMYFNILTINNGAVVKTGAFPVYAKEIINNGTIGSYGNAANFATPGAALVAGVFKASIAGAGPTPVGAAANCSAASVGTPGNGNHRGNSESAGLWVNWVSGGRGGAGGTAGGYSGGASPTIAIPLTPTPLTVGTYGASDEFAARTGKYSTSSTFTAFGGHQGGGSGSNGGYGACGAVDVSTKPGVGGRGGASGGDSLMVSIFAQKISGSGSIVSKGGAGGGGASGGSASGGTAAAGGGGGGGGGSGGGGNRIFVNYSYPEDPTPFPWTIDVSGGAGGLGGLGGPGVNGGSSGADGSAGNTGPSGDSVLLHGG